VAVETLFTKWQLKPLQKELENAVICANKPYKSQKDDEEY